MDASKLQEYRDQAAQKIWTQRLRGSFDSWGCAHLALNQDPDACKICEDASRVRYDPDWHDIDVDCHEIEAIEAAERVLADHDDALKEIEATVCFAIRAGQLPERATGFELASWYRAHFGPDLPSLLATLPAEEPKVAGEGPEHAAAEQTTDGPEDEPWDYRQKTGEAVRIEDLPPKLALAVRAYLKFKTEERWPEAKEAVDWMRGHGGQSVASSALRWIARTIRPADAPNGRPPSQG